MTILDPPRSDLTATVHILGIRHHGPGSARSLGAALEALRPDAVLVEGPPDADALIPLLAHAEMKPPVALLVYGRPAASEPVYYPFAVFSPEWQAIRYALDKGSRSASWTCPRPTSSPSTEEPARPEEADPMRTATAERSRRSWPAACGSTRSSCWPRRRASATASGGGSTWSSTAATAPTSSPRSSKR